MRMQVVALVIAAAGMVAAGCDSGDDPPSSASSSTSSSTSSTSSSVPQGSPQDSATVIALKDFMFDPADATVSQTAVALDLTNSGRVAHTFTMDNPKVDQELAPGTSTQVLVSLAGQTEAVYYCRFHRAMGMQGKLTLRSP